MISRATALPVIWRAQLRLSAEHPLVTSLHIAAIALAVAVLFATAITRYSSSTSLALANRGLSGASDAQLVAAGGPRLEQYAELRRRWLSRYPGLHLQPVLEGRVSIGGESFTVSGIDPLAAPRSSGLAPLLIGRRGAVIHNRDAARLGAGVGDVLPVAVDDRTSPLLIGAETGNPGLAGRLLVDIATARRLLGRAPAVLDRIEVHLPNQRPGIGGHGGDRESADPITQRLLAAARQADGPGSVTGLLLAPLPSRQRLVGQLQQALEALPGPALTWVASDSQRTGQRRLIEAFEFNLQALSLLALLVAGLLLASTAQFSFRHRRPLLQRLRELGVAPARLWRLTLAEALLLALVGSLIGWLLGGLLSLALLPLVASSIETLYDTGGILRFPPDPWSYLWPAVLSALLLLGVQGWQLWRWQKPPIGGRWRRWLVLASAGAAAVGLQDPGLEGAYLAVFATAAAGLLVLPDVSRWLLRSGGRLRWPGAPLLRLGWRDAARQPPHLAMATAALCLALAASLAVSLMAGSLRQAVQDWLAQQLAADVYLNLQDPAQAHPQQAYWAGRAGVDRVSIRLRHTWPVAGQRVSLEGLSSPAAASLPLLDCPASCLQRWRQGAVLASEPLARRLQLDPGDQLEIPGAGILPIAGLIRDFDPGGGRLVLPLPAYHQAGFEPRQASLGLWLSPSADREQLYRMARKAGLQVVDPAQTRRAVDALFARTFTVTDWLRLAVLAIALLAVIAGLSLQAIHHRSQLAVLRALGTSPLGACGWLAIQAAATTIGAALWALPLGYALAWLLVHEVNPRAFGWSLALQPQPGVALALIPLALLAALLSMPWPCWQLLRRVGILSTGLAALTLTGCGAEPSGSEGEPLQTTTAWPAQAYAQALAPRSFDFPTDHGPHPEFRDEWWYVTGNLYGEDGHRYGFQLTLFRRALRPGIGPLDGGQAYMGHFALTDVAAGRFLHDERFGSTLGGVAGSVTTPPQVWLDDWRLIWRRDHWHLMAAYHGRTLDLRLTPTGPPVLQGEAGLSRKNALPGNASYYYSQPRLQAVGQLGLASNCRSGPPAAPPLRRAAQEGCIAEAVQPVSGLAWLDREWGSSELAPEQQGWDWFALQLEDGSSLMLYQLRERDGRASNYSAGTLVYPNGAYTDGAHADHRIVRLRAGHFSLRPLGRWHSPDGASIPVRWQLEIPGQGIRWQIVAVLPDQYLEGNFSYWEGAVDVIGDGDLIGRGYLEMTGYGESRR